jgi:hypothetical protein
MDTEDSPRWRHHVNEVGAVLLECRTVLDNAGLGYSTPELIEMARLVFAREWGWPRRERPLHHLILALILARDTLFAAMTLAFHYDRAALGIIEADDDEGLGHHVERFFTSASKTWPQWKALKALVARHSRRDA